MQLLRRALLPLLLFNAASAAVDPAALKNAAELYRQRKTAEAQKAFDALAACIHVPLLLWIGSRLGEGAGSLAEAWRRVAFLAGGLAGAALLHHLGRRPRRDAARSGQGTARSRLWG